MNIIQVIIFCVAFLAICPFRTKAQKTCDGTMCYVNGVPRACSEVPTHVCCKGPNKNQWLMVERRQGEKCCHGSGMVYDPTREVCVNGTVREKRTNNELECGLTATYDKSIEKCCKKNSTYGRVYQKIGVCCNETNLVDPDLDCCEGLIYNRTLQTCCERSDDGLAILYNLKNGDCCLDTPYDPARQKCQDFEIFNKTENETSKCHAQNGIDVQLYNNRTKMCCSGEVYSKSDFICFGGVKVIPKAESKHNQVCAEHNRQTNEATYTTFYSGPESRKECVKGRIISLSENQEICSSPEIRVYDPRFDLCCHDGKFYPKGKKKGLKCCPSPYEAYDPASQTCCHHKIFNISETSGGKCCRDVAYDAKIQRCNEEMRVVKALCPNPNKPPYPERCNATIEDMESVRDFLKKGGYYVYFVTITSDPHQQPIMKKKRKWWMNDIVHITSKSKKKKASKINIKKINRSLLTVNKCTCPYELIDNERYALFSAKPIGKRPKKFQKNDAIIPLNSNLNLGNWLSVLFGSL